MYSGAHLLSISQLFTTNPYFHPKKQQQDTVSPYTQHVHGYRARTGCRVEGTDLSNQKNLHPNSPRLYILRGAMDPRVDQTHACMTMGERAETWGSRRRQGKMDSIFQHINYTTQAWCCFLSKRLPDLLKTLEKTNLLGHLWRPINIISNFFLLWN